MKKKTKSSAMKKADKLFSLYWREKIGQCEQCGKRENLQLAHIITRDCRKLRYERDNTFVLCSGCHFLFHKKPLEFYEFVEKKKGKGSSKKLIISSNKLTPLTLKFYEDTIKRIQKSLEELSD